MAYSLKKGYPIPEEGNHEAVICGVDILKGETVTVKGKKKLRDIIQVEFQMEQGKARGRYFPLLVEESPLGQLVSAINDGEIPDDIEDVEEFLMNSELIIEVKHNKSKETGRLFANAINTYPLEEYDDEGEGEEDEEEYDLDVDDEEQDEEEELDIDLSENFHEEELDWS